MNDAISVIGSRGEYHVYFAPHIASVIGKLAIPEKTWVLIDPAVLAGHRSALSGLNGFPTKEIIADETAKAFEALGPLFEWLLETGFRRDCRILAIGGGVIQDIAAFVCSVILRGVEWDFIPTTLLSQCDSCIGAKSSINLGRFKNQIGTFNAPRSIHITTDILNTLPPDAIRSGLCEVAKFHLLNGHASWDWFRALGNPMERQGLPDLIRRSLLIKKPYIESDEFDRGIRNLLNYGHTFGHAYESASGFKIPHGQAVALGMVSATYVSLRRKMIDEAHFHEVLAAIRPLYAPFEQLLADLEPREIVSAMGNDKKNMSGKTYCILTRGPGTMERVAVDLPGEISPALVDLFSRHL